MIARRHITLAGSAALHGAALAGVLAFAVNFREPRPLFVDLTGEVPTGGARAAASHRPREAGAPPARGTPRERAGAPRAPAPPALGPTVGTAPEPAPSSSAPRETAASDHGTASSFAITDGGGARGVASDAPAHPGQPAPAAAGAGSPLALAGPGAGRGEAPAEFGPYLAGFRQRIQDLVVYPLAARRRGLAGRVEVELLLEPSGRVRDVAVVASSSHDLLDEAAVEAVRALEPLPLPGHLPRRALRVRLPVVFQLR